MRGVAYSSCTVWVSFGNGSYAGAYSDFLRAVYSTSSTLSPLKAPHILRVARYLKRPLDIAAKTSYQKDKLKVYFIIGCAFFHFQFASVRNQTTWQVVA